ncbi:RNA polymerase sigma factor [Spirochaetia bacterium]|nr:RNA polymerase sigma factor [Spirochaetia bacterium]
MTAIKVKKSKRMVKDSDFDENTLKMYFKEISRFPLLSKEEELETARAAVEGNRAAREKLTNSNLRYVVSVAKKFQGQGVPLSDLIGEGNIGLMNAIDRFDANKGCRFITYATWWIRQAILEALCEKRMIRLPRNRTAELIQIEKAREQVQYHQTAGSELMEIAGLLDMDIEHVRDLLNISKEMVSLDTPVVGNDAVVGDFIEAEQYLTPDDSAMDQLLSDDIENVLRTLDQKEAAVIRYRFGLGHCPALTLSEVGDYFNISKERVRQIEEKAISRLKNPVRSYRLMEYA